MTDSIFIVVGLIVGSLGIFAYIFLFTRGFEQRNKDPQKSLHADKSKKNYRQSVGDGIKYIIGLVIFFIIMLILSGC